MFVGYKEEYTNDDLYVYKLPQYLYAKLAQQSQLTSFAEWLIKIVINY